jgi:hypothetical protein
MLFYLQSELKQLRVAVETANVARAQGLSSSSTGASTEERVRELETTLFTTVAALRAERR